ncbi:MAG: hypothetical protein ACK4GW_07915 [Pseudorhodobacter sp.]
MTANESDIEISVLPLSWHALSQLSGTQKAFFVLTSHALTECNIYFRLFQLHINQPKDDISRSLTIIQCNAIRRTLTSKAFEAIEFIFKISKRKSVEYEEIKTLLNEFKDRIAHLRGNNWRPAANGATSHPGLSKVAWIRNQVCNHFSIESVVARIEAMEDNPDAWMYIGDEAQNCYFEIGEAVGFSEPVRVARKDGSGSFETVEDSDIWSDWVAEAVILLREVHAKFYKEVVAAKITPFPVVEPRVIPAEMVANLGEYSVPLVTRATP